MQALLAQFTARRREGSFYLCTLCLVLQPFDAACRVGVDSLPGGRFDSAAQQPMDYEGAQENFLISCSLRLHRNM